MPDDDIYITALIAAPLPPLTYKMRAEGAVRGAPILAQVGSRLLPGVVLEAGVSPPAGVTRFKYASRIEGLPPWGEEYLQFIRKLSGYYFAEEGRTLAMAFPPLALLAPKERHVRYVALLPSAVLDGMTAKQRRAAEILQEKGRIPLTDAAALAECGEDVFKRMAKAGAVAISESCLPGEDFVPETPAISDAPALDGAQAAAFAALRGACGNGAGFSASLIKGVTGSGKTEAFFALMEESLAQNPHGQCLLLTPEISLTAQMIARAHKRFGHAPAMWHHGITPAERRRNWRRVCRGEARVIVGARSALMLPYAQLRMIVVDEEHENSYKQEDGICYHARDMAVLRASCEKFPVILASATPSLETLHNVASGKYAMAELPARFGAASMPEVRVIPMKGRKKPQSQWLADEVIAAVKNALAQGEQALLFVNRRGYAPLALCASCGFVCECDACSAAMPYHKSRDALLCHHCGKQASVPSACPSCAKSGSIAFCGPGVERLAAEARKLFPAARSLCLSGDSAGDMEQAAAGEFDILVGTQIIAKGLHFPHLTVVCVADADMGLYGADPRAREKTFQLIRQVSGRAGRADKPGTVYLQSFAPERPLFAMLQQPDDAPFIASETEERKLAAMPPFARMAMAHFSSKNEAEALAAARRFAEGIDRSLASVLGPAPAPVKKIKYAFRVRLALKSSAPAALSAAIAGALRRYVPSKDVEMKIDRDPVSL